MIEKKIIKKILKNKSSINMEDFIKICLYGSEGYYNKKNILGKSGDFITAPEISQLFGEIIGLFIFYFWKTNIKKKFNLIELGPGRGTLLIDILNITKNFKKFSSSLRITLIENNDYFIVDQKENLKKFVNNLTKITWSKTFNKLSKLPTIIYANEFLDCLPIRQFYLKKNNWYEKLINYDSKNHQLFIENTLVKDKKMLSKFNSQNHNGILEISNEREKYFKKICLHLKKNQGMCIIFDYGYYSPIKNFSLQSIYKHKKTNILSNPGMQDITSFVNFKILIDIAKKNNLKIHTFCNQSEYLKLYGIKERKEIILKNCNKKQKKIIEEGYNRITNKKNMGSLFKVLIITS